MRNTLAILQKELWYFAVTPGSYVVVGVFLLLSGVMFANLTISSMSESISIYPLFVAFYGIVGLILGVLFAPMLSMRTLSEEARSGTIEQLLTMPIRDFEVVIGKFLACFAFLAVLVTLTLYYPLGVQWFANGEPDWGPILGTYFGTLLLGGASLSIGILASSLSQNQIVALVISVVVIGFLWLLGPLAFIPLMAQLSMSSHMGEFTKGVVDSRDVIYYISVIAVALFLTTRSLEARRWR
jgi:ABC-2 type transport system permease protein